MDPEWVQLAASVLNTVFIQLKAVRQLFKKAVRINNVCLTCMGVLAEDKAVKPTISLKKMVTCGKVSGATVPPRFNSSATDLNIMVYLHYAIFNCDLFLLSMGWIGVGDVVVIVQCEHLYWILYNPLLVIRNIAVAIAQSEWAFTLLCGLSI